MNEPNAFDLHAYLTQKARLINEALERSLDDSGDNRRILNAMHYSLMAGGKRIRPILCIAAAETVTEKPPDSLIHVACALEMIHTYSLIHDDLPAMDNDDLRRGKPTCHIAFDEATAILAGDALLTMGFQKLSAIQQIETGVEAERKSIEIINLIACAAGYQGMIEGQMRDIASENKPLTLSDLESMHRLKTGALIKAAVKAGGIIGECNKKQLEFLEQYAGYIGLAFQVMDDILNVVGNPEVMGKATGTDQIRSKNTYPSIIGLEASKQLAKDLINNSLRSLELFDNKADPLRAIARYIIERNY